MVTLASLIEEVGRNASAREAMHRIEASLARRSLAEQHAFWRAIDLYYVSRKAPGAEAARPEIMSDTAAPE